MNAIDPDLTAIAASYVDPAPGDRQLESLLIYAVMVAGKNAKTTQKALERFIGFLPPALTPLNAVRTLRPDDLYYRLVVARTGSYTRLHRALLELAYARLDLRTCSVQELEGIHGIGPKTARFFVLWTRPGARHAALDVHVLRWLRTELKVDAPASTPGNPKVYARLEQVFLDAADQRGMTPRELDEMIWTAGSGWTEDA